MAWFVRALSFSALLMLGGTAAAQDYIDLESERGEGPLARPTDPYASPSTPAYPTTSYGLNAAPAAPATPVQGTPGGNSQASGPDNLGALLYQLQQLQREVMSLNGRLEEQAHELRQLKEQNLERYLDLDRRLGAMAGGAAVVGSVTPATTGNGKSTPVVVGGKVAAEQPGEGDAYRAAYGLVRSQQFDDAIAAFKGFLQSYPDGRYAPNAHYWLGELYLVVTPQDLESSRQSFSLLLSQYPDNPKAPDALYKLGKVQFLKGNRERARQYFDQLINDYSAGNHAAVQLARDFIAENY